MDGAIIRALEDAVLRPHTPLRSPRTLAHVATRHPFPFSSLSSDLYFTLSHAHNQQQELLVGFTARSDGQYEHMMPTFSIHLSVTTSTMSFFAHPLLYRSPASWSRKFGEESNLILLRLSRQVMGDLQKYMEWEKWEMFNRRAERL